MSEMISSLPMPKFIRSHTMHGESLKEHTSLGVGQELQAVRSAFAECPYKELQRVIVEISGKTIRLDGKASSFFMKQMAQEIVRATTKTVEVDNGIYVIYPQRQEENVE